MVKRTLVVALVALVVAAGAVLWSRSGKVGTYPRRNVLIVSIDTLRADHMASYGYHRETSPTIDALSKRAITFDLAFAPRGSTWPSLATMLTSLSPDTHNVRENGQYLPPGTPTLADVFRSAGYDARAFVSGSVCHMTRRITAFERIACGEDTYVAAQAVEYLRSAGERPFFAWVHLIAPHGPYEPPAEYDRFRDRAYTGPVAGTQDALGAIIRNQKPLTDADRAQLYGLYDGEILFADAQVALLLDALEARGLGDDTIIAFLADHGEELADHNGYLYHSCSVYDSVLRIPLMLALPDGAAAGRRVGSIVQTQDLAPTLLELTQAAPLQAAEGTSLLRRLDDERAADDESTYAPSEWYEPETGRTVQTLRTRRWRYVSNPDLVTPRCPPKGDYYKVAREELYDHTTDPLDQHDVAAQHPDIAQRFAAITSAAHAGAASAEPQTIDKNLLEELRSFGYVE